MELIADLHIHSKYAYATSKFMDLAEIYKWSKIKGINIVATGDFTHPEWFKTIQNELESTGKGLFKFRNSKAITDIPASVNNIDTHFVLSVEVSNIFRHKGLSKRVHNIVLMPDLRSAAEFIKKVGKYGNLGVDGRPILKLSSEDLMKLTLNITPKSLVIPAHIWTPWYGTLGARSGFDSVAEAFGDHFKYVYAIETGLSSDPYMNWAVCELKNLAITSHSDAHSVKKLGREATVLNIRPDYSELFEALKTNDKRMVGTIEFYPEEGKYHYTGHRNCKVKMNPEEAAKVGNICPVCGRKLTEGVLGRVYKLSGGEEFKTQGPKRVEYIIPLEEIIAETEQVKSTSSKKVESVYFGLIERFGSEFDILRKVRTDLIKGEGYEKVALSIKNMREGKVIRSPGYDGVYGTISCMLEEQTKLI